jgi:tetratricopeptide (TPR) repeat protein
MENVEWPGPVPPDAAAVYEMVKGLYQQGRFDEIVSLCERAEAVGRYNADVAASHSVALVKLKRFDDAIAFLQMALGYFPQDARLHFNLGTALTTVGRRQEGSAEYAIAKRLDPEAVGKKVDKFNNRKVVALVASSVVFFTLLLFWPHTKWAVVGLLVVLIGLSVFVLIKTAGYATRNRVLMNVGVLALWVIFLVIALLA